jgi:hypothetical protein
MNVERAQAFLAARYGVGVSDLTPIAHGEWSAAFAVRHDDRARVVRFSALDEDLRLARLSAGESPVRFDACLNPDLLLPHRRRQPSDRFSGRFVLLSSKDHGQACDGAIA